MADEKKEESKTPPVNCVVILSYDLTTFPGVHDQFIKLMKDRHWSFSYSGKKLPATTCSCIFPGWAKAKAIAEMHKDINEAEVEIQKTTKAFKVERRYAVAFLETESLPDFKSITKD